jgi:MATE family multidrug resistance protein
VSQLLSTPTPPAEGDRYRWWGVGEVARMAAPTILSMASYTLMQFADSWMVARGVGGEAFGAQFIGGMASFVAATFFLGTLSCINTFAAQNVGAGRPERAAQYGWQGIWLGLATWALLAAVLVPLAPKLLGLFPHETALVQLEVHYFRILAVGWGPILVARALGPFFIGIHKPTVVLLAGGVANSLNILLNYLLIYGHWGFPRLGLTGAGIGTVIGSALQAAILLAVFLWGLDRRQFRVLESIGLSWRAIRDLLRIGTPAGAVMLSGTLMFLVFLGGIVGQFGAGHLGAAGILHRYLHLCLMPALGVGAASTALVGRYCGAKRPDLAWRRAHAALLLVELYMVGIGVVMWFLRADFVALFLSEEWAPSVRETAQEVATNTMAFLVVVQALFALNVTFTGALRGAGDTLWPGAVNIAASWGLGVGGGWLVTRLVPSWESYGPWAVMAGFQSLLGLVMWGRFLGGRWRRFKLVHDDEPAAAE